VTHPGSERADEHAAASRAVSAWMLQRRVFAQCDELIGLRQGDRAPLTDLTSVDEEAVGAIPTPTTGVS